MASSVEPKRRLSAFVPPKGALMPHARRWQSFDASILDQKARKVFDREVFGGGKRMVRLSELHSPFRPINPKTEALEELTEFLSQNKSKFLENVKKYLDLTLQNSQEMNQRQETIKKEMDSFAERYRAFTQKVQDLEENLSQTRQSDLSSVILNLEKMLGHQESKLAALDKINLEDLKEEAKVKKYVEKLREHTVEYIDPDIQIFIEEKREENPGLSSTLDALEEANNENREVNQSYYFLRGYLENGA